MAPTMRSEVAERQLHRQVVDLIHVPASRMILYVFCTQMSVRPDQAPREACRHADGHPTVKNTAVMPAGGPDRP